MTCMTMLPTPLRIFGFSVTDETEFVKTNSQKRNGSFSKNILTRVEGRDILTKLSRKSAARSLKNGITERGKHLQKISDGTRQFFRVTTTQKSKEQKKALERF